MPMKLELLARAQRILLLRMASRALANEPAPMPVDAELQAIIADLKSKST